MKLIIVRHGETEENRAGIIQGHFPGVLSELGREQARKLAKRLKNEKIDLIISSDLARALDTAKEIVKFHANTDLVPDERLRERYFKKFEGKRKKDLRIPKNARLIDYCNEEDIESDEEVFTRVKSLIKNILEKEEENILLVGHMGVCKFVVATLLNKEIENLRGMKLKNTSVSIFEREDEKIKMRLLNCTEHLK